MTRILVAEDEEVLARSLSTYLRRQGHEVRTVETGREAMLGMDGVKLVITDINMPDMDGIELIIALRQGHPNTPVIAMSGGGLFPKEMLLDNADALGAVVTLKKPFDLEAFGATVREVLGDTDASSDS